MANRPGQLCELKSGKSIGAQKNLADTFNWIAACMSKIKAGKGIKLSWPAPDTPEISLDKTDEGGDDGGSSTDCVVDVERGEATTAEDGYTVTENLKVTYSTGDTKDVPLPSNNGVADIGESSITEGKRLTVEYENAKPDKAIDIPYRNEFTGTDNSYTRRDTDFTFASASDSNVTVKCIGNVLTIGVYYT